MRPELLALRVTNQYRTRDVIAYLGLRYYFSNTCARRDRWGKEVATHLVRSRSDFSYFESIHFKDFLENDEIHHRKVFLPNPNEAFAEAALLAECAKHSSFTPLPCVFSYHLASEDDSRGVFAPYFDGFRKRHEQIREACRDMPDASILYTDIKRFYPSIPAAAASDAWNKACIDSTLEASWHELGKKLLADHLKIAKENGDDHSILTGPMFSHLIANLVMRTVDTHMTALFPNRYFRYVDDVVLVGSTIQIKDGREILNRLLVSLDLHLHDSDKGKDFQVDATQWLEGQYDLDNDNGIKWANFVGEIKNFVVTRQDANDLLTSKFFDADFRIPLPAYNLDINSAPWLFKFRRRLNTYPWLKRYLKNIRADSLVDTATQLREVYSKELRSQVLLGLSQDRFTRKRAVPKLRFLAGRLLYIGSREMLIEFSETLKEISELKMLAVILRAVATRDVSELLPLGSNAVQSAAQVLSLSTELVSCNIADWTPVTLQGLAILRLNGIPLNGPIDDPLNRLALWTEESSTLMSEGYDSSLKELACLHGVSDRGRHAETISSVFDWDETLAFDAINQARDSGY